MPITTKLTITDDQEAVVRTAEAHLEEAFRNGSQDNAATPNSLSDVMPPFDNYADIDALEPENPGVFQKIRGSYLVTIAVIMKVLNIPRAFPVTRFNGTITVAKLTTGGTNGSMTFVDGICTNAVDPT